MPSKAYTSAGTEIYISSEVPGTISGADFRVLDYTTIGEVTDISEFTESVDTLSYYELRNSRPEKIKGNRDSGSMQVSFARSTKDTGQTDIVTALQSPNNFSFRLFVYDPDVPDTYYFTAKVTDLSVAIGGADQIVQGTATLQITSEVMLDEDYFVLEYGYWDDRGIWFDTDTWYDGVA